jgi:predicted DNA-binding protein (UPF0278 family)
LEIHARHRLDQSADPGTMTPSDDAMYPVTQCIHPVKTQMKFHVEFVYSPSNRDNLKHFLNADGLAAEGSLKIEGAWVAAQTGTAYAIVSARDAKSIYEMSSSWAEYGDLTITPILAVADL